MAREKLKTPKDYGSLSFRCTEEEKSTLNTDIEAVTKLYNARLEDDERVWRKNDVIMEALRIGLAAMKKKGGK